MQLLMEAYRKIFIHRGSKTTVFHSLETLFYRYWRHFKIIFTFTTINYVIVCINYYIWLLWIWRY